jgi:NADH-quinone oxidoreductase subunit A
MGQYLPVLALGALAFVFAILSIMVSRLMAPRLMTPAKEAPYECGIVPSREPPERFPVKFFLVAMIFIVFDIEIIFFIPWAVVFRDLGAFGLWSMLIFAALVFESFLYLVSKGALDWGPVKRVVQALGQVGAHRTTESTVRRVGLDGRDAPPEPAEEVAA